MNRSLLIVDDDHTVAMMFKSVLEKEGYKTFVSKDGHNIQKIIAEHKIDVILLDVILPDLSGFQILQFLQSSERLREIPVIMVTGLTAATDVKTALDSGAHDYIRKPCEPIELIARVGSAMRIKIKQDMLNGILNKDSLTELYNRRHFNLTIGDMMSRRNEYEEGISLLMIDCDYFKRINDSYGHIMGDDVLISVANVLKKSVKRTDVAFRYGGEEFCIVLPNTSLKNAFTVAERIRQNISKMTFNHLGKIFSVTASCGVSHTVNGDGKAALTFINESDMALYEAKKSGRNMTKIFKYGS